MKGTSLMLVTGLLASPSILAEASQTINIPAQPLANALEQFSLQTGLQVLYSGDAVAGKTSPSVSGQYSPRQALERLIGDSGLAFQIADNRTVTIKKGAPGTADKPTKLEEVFVTATKTERLASEVPATVAIVEAEQIENMYSRDSSDLLTRSAGVDIARSGTSGISTLNIRGTGSRRSSVLVNGQYAEFLDIGIGNQNTLQTIDWDNIERLEVVRGAGSALYGPNAMGGVVNVITKDAPEKKTLPGRFSYSTACRLTAVGYRPAAPWMPLPIN